MLTLARMTLFSEYEHFLILTTCSQVEQREEANNIMDSYNIEIELKIAMKWEDIFQILFKSVIIEKI